MLAPMTLGAAHFISGNYPDQDFQNNPDIQKNFLPVKAVYQNCLNCFNKTKP